MSTDLIHLASRESSGLGLPDDTAPEKHPRTRPNGLREYVWVVLVVVLLVAIWAIIVTH